jgi:hypothetical protein
MLTSYRAGRHERKLVVERLGPAEVRILDTPHGGDGETYVVELLDLELDGAGALQALVEHYVEHAQQIGNVPMATSLLRDYLDELAGGGVSR